MLADTVAALVVLVSVACDWVVTEGVDEMERGCGDVIGRVSSCVEAVGGF